MIGPYEVLAELGRGGMATVYRAHDPKFNRDVAIKVLPREMTHDPDFRTRFEREGRTIAALEHSAIVPVYDIGESDGQPYLVMRLMSGGSLAQRIFDSPLPLDETVKIMDRIADGLDAAHERKIIHRDLKPGNILFDRYQNAFLSDFGIVKLSESTRNITYGLIGTPGYMAPEMMEAEGFDHRIDIYALGITLYEMLAGHVPYVASTPGGILMAHVNKPIPDIRVERPELPAAVQDVIRLGMAKNPASRYQSAGELAADLRQALQTGSISKRPPIPATMPELDAALPPTQLEHEVAHSPTVVEPPERSLTTRPVVWLGAGGVILVLLVAGILATVAIITLTREPNTIIVEATPGPENEIMETTVPTPSATPIPAATSTVDPMVDLAALAQAGVTRASEWQPVTRTLAGVEMVLVPAGCFSMGNRGTADDETPEHEYCIEAPFWLDKTEVSNGDYAPVGNAQIDLLPRQSVSWFDAQAHCEDFRGGRLPMEVEWEFAASGPDNFFYPYGDSFDGSAANFCDENCTNDNLREADYNDGFAERAPVGSFPDGASWVGALDMAGNVSEWVYSLYLPYPYDPLDGREAALTEDRTSERAYRGGSYSSSATILRTSWRNGVDPASSFTGIGFRCMRVFDPADLSQ